MLFEGQYLGAELKAMHKPKYQQSPSDRVVFPVDQWVQVTWHVYLHPDQGRVRIFVALSPMARYHDVHDKR